MGFYEEEQDWMFRVTCGILIVGNATFAPHKEGSKQMNAQDVKLAANYFDLDAKLLDKTL